MSELDALEKCYTDYVEKVDKLLKNLKPADGIFGFGNDPKKASCHDDFYEECERIVSSMVQNDTVSAEEKKEAFGLLLTKPVENEGNDLTYWMMYAAMGHARMLLPALTPKDAAVFRDYFDAHYPKLDRMPVQRDLYKSLKKAAAGK